MSQISTVCVYCGASAGLRPSVRAAAAGLAREIVGAGCRLVYGGGRVGLMGILADAALAANGHVTGIIPAHIQEKEVQHTGLSELLVVDSMHTRKRMMVERSDAFAVLPGGIGTLDEFVEIVTWRQLGLHDKPIVLVDLDDYWRQLLELMEQMEAMGFLRPTDSLLFERVETVADVMPTLRHAAAPARPTRVDQA